MNGERVEHVLVDGVNVSIDNSDRVTSPAEPTVVVVETNDNSLTTREAPGASGWVAARGGACDAIVARGTHLTTCGLPAAFSNRTPPSCR